MYIGFDSCILTYYHFWHPLHLFPFVLTSLKASSFLFLGSLPCSSVSSPHFVSIWMFLLIPCTRTRMITFQPVTSLKARITKPTLPTEKPIHTNNYTLPLSLPVCTNAYKHSKTYCIANVFMPECPDPFYDSCTLHKHPFNVMYTLWNISNPWHAE